MKRESEAYKQLFLLAQTYMELGQVGDMMEGLARASTERPELARQYYDDKLAASPGAVEKIVPALAPQNDPTRRSEAMASRTAVPFDYATRSALADVDTLLVSKAISGVEAQRRREAITTAYAKAHAQPAPSAPDPLRTAITPRRTARPEVSVGQAVAVVEKQAPASPPLSATDTLMKAIATKQAAELGLSFVAASDRVNQEDPTLHERHMMEMRYQPQSRSQPVAKTAPPTYEAILKQAQATQTSGQTTEQALAALALAHPNDSAYWEAHRRWHGSPEALREHHAAATLAKSRADYRP